MMTMSLPSNIWEAMEDFRAEIFVILALGILLAFFVHLWARGELKWFIYDVQRSIKKLLR